MLKFALIDALKGSVLIQTILLLKLKQVVLLIYSFLFSFLKISGRSLFTLFVLNVQVCWVSKCV